MSPAEKDVVEEHYSLQCIRPASIFTVTHLLIIIINVIIATMKMKPMTYVCTIISYNLK